MLRVVSANVNGVRAAARRGGLAWLAAQEPDVLCLQEVRSTDEQLAQVLAGAGLDGWAVAHTEGAAKGRAGVAVLSRAAQLDVRFAGGCGALDRTGRWVEVDLATDAGPLTLVSVYVPTGEAGTPGRPRSTGSSTRCPPGCAACAGTARPWWS